MKIILIVFLITFPLYAFEASVGISTSPLGSGGWGAYNWKLQNGWLFLPGVFAKFSSFNRNNTLKDNDENFRRTLSDKIELGFSFTNQGSSFRPYIGLGLAVLYPDHELQDKSSLGGIVALGFNQFFHEHYAFVFEHSENFGFAPTHKVQGSPNLFNTSEVSSGLLMKF